jgi:TfoX N-terminal domain
MAYSEFLADRVRQRLSKKIVIEKKMMGGLVFMVNEKMCVGVDIDRKSGQDRLMIRVGKDAHEKLISKKGCKEMDFTGKPMKGFLFIYPEGFDKEADLDFWIRQALEFNENAKKPK